MPVKKIETDNNLLIVDDQNEVSKMLNKILRRNGYKNIYLADSGKKALFMLNKFPINFIITDWHMPNMTGIELLITIRRDQRYQDIPVLMVTEEMSKEKVVYAIEEGIDGYQEKPFSEKSIIDAIKKILYKKLHPDPLQYKIQKLSSLKLQKKYDEALAFAKEILRQGENPDILFISSECYLYKKDCENAKKYIQKALEIRRDSKALNLLGKIYMAEKKFEESIEYLKEASLMNPLNLNRKIEVGNVYLKLGLIDEASETFSYIKESDPTDLNYINMGSAYLDSGDVRKAGEYIEQATDPIPETISVFNNYAIELRKIGAFEEAINQYNKCLALYPKHHVILYNLGKAYFEKGKYKEAKTALEKSIAAKPLDQVKRLLVHVESKIRI